MKAQIQLTVCALSQICCLDQNQSRRIYLQQQKQHIYQYRNQCLAQQLKTEVTEQDIAKTSHGKPYLIDQTLAFNHSHSQQYYALATSDTVSDLGVDIEDLARKVRFDSLAKHAFHADELQKWYESEQDPKYWFQVWTAKEAILKAAGLGIRLSLNELNTQTDTAVFHPLIGTFSYRSFFSADYCVTLAWRGEQEVEILHEKTHPKMGLEMI